ncbi:LysM peptidoglycan-binding domain-containing protein [Hymenobacter perfusus]|uniref:LysM peptidoglycan-binding domain-containing protein n=1 Tax=Hymenobacter perfusus TaxID=1236770 RepID=A0A428KHJ4_9BACT|nr:LysM peptidoglycan-binding domain-containing protein [Hymenobacter perfusus]RSK45828.1 LysM peptidoglycan-binding domain-containing protein [Hymenobacter perfusus]
MRFFSVSLVLAVAGTVGSFRAQAQQTTPISAVTLSNDSVQVMSALVESSVRQLRAIYFEPNDAKTTQLIDEALVRIPALNQRLSRYTASLPREQQQQLAQRLRQQPWQVELNTLLRSPQYKGFDARAAKTPELKAAAERLHASGFMGTAKPVAAKIPAPAPMGTIVTTAPATKPQPVAAAAKLPAGTSALVPATRQQPTSLAKPAGEASRNHTVQKGETLFSISRQYNVTAAQLLEWNGKADGKVKIGEVLVVEPAKAAAPTR